MRKVKVVSYNPAWQEAFKLESQQIAKIIGNDTVAIHHIGSTAIPGIYAKPIIDVLVEVKAIAHVDQHNETFKQLGYAAMGEYGIPGRRYFRKNNELGIPTHHIHIFEVGSEHIERHISFRDYLINHPQEAEAYSNLKRQLAQAYPTNIEAYMDGKDSFIQHIEAKACAWRSSSSCFNKTR